MGYFFLALLGILIGLGLVRLEPYSLWAVPAFLLGGIAFVIRPLWIIGALLAVATLRLVWKAGGVAPLELAYSLAFSLLFARTFIREGFVTPSDGRKAQFKSPILLPFLIFLLLSVSSAFIAWMHGHSFVTWASDLNMILFYAFYFIVVGTVKTPKELDRLLAALIWITAVAVLRSAYEEIRTHSFTTVLYGETVIKFPIASAFSLNLFLILLPILLFVREKGGKRVVLFLFCFLFGIHQLLASVRSRWLGAIVALMAIFLAAPSFQKARLLRPLFILTLGLSFLMMLSLTIPAFSRNPAMAFTQMIQKRFATIFKGRADPTTEARFLEWEAAMTEVRKHPWFGSGLGKEVSYFDTTLYHPSFVTVRYIHNSYLFYLLNMGLAGLLAFLWLCGSFLLYGLKVFRSLADPYCKGMALGFWAAFLAMLIAGFAGASLNDPALTIWAGFLMGAVTVLDKRRGPFEEESHEPA